MQWITKLFFFTFCFLLIIQCSSDLFLISFCVYLNIWYGLCLFCTFIYCVIRVTGICAFIPIQLHGDISVDIIPRWKKLISTELCILAYLWLPLCHVGECYIANSNKHSTPVVCSFASVLHLVWSLLINYTSFFSFSFFIWIYSLEALTFTSYQKRQTKMSSGLLCECNFDWGFYTCSF